MARTRDIVPAPTRGAVRLIDSLAVLRLEIISNMKVIGEGAVETLCPKNTKARLLDSYPKAGPRV